jgi:hypothetical protein
MARMTVREMRNSVCLCRRYTASICKIMPAIAYASLSSDDLRDATLPRYDHDALSPTAHRVRPPSASSSSPSRR